MSGAAWSAGLDSLAAWGPGAVPMALGAALRGWVLLQGTEPQHPTPGQGVAESLTRAQEGWAPNAWGLRVFDIFLGSWRHRSSRC